MPSGFWSLGLIGWARHSSCCSHILLGNLVRELSPREPWSWTCRGLEKVKPRTMGRWTERGGREQRFRKWWERKFLFNIHHQSSSAAGNNNNLCAVTMVTGQTAVNMTAEAAVCPLRLEPPNTTTLILTYADGDVCGPLIVVLAGDCSLADQLKAKLTLKPQDSSIREVLPFSNAIERSPRVSATLFVDF